MSTQSNDVVYSQIVEKFDHHEIEGWLEVGPEDGPLTVSVCLNGAPVQAVKGIRKSLLSTRNQIQYFRFDLSDLWDFTKIGDQISVESDRGSMPIAGVGMFMTCGHNGSLSIDDLASKLEAGYIFDQTGTLRLSKSKDADWQAAAMGLYSKVKDALGSSVGYEPFLIYGTLLGAVRDQTVIGQDLDFDAAYISKHDHVDDVTRELLEVGFRLIDDGFNVSARASGLNVSHASFSGATLDLYHLYADGQGDVQFPFGVADHGRLRKSSVTKLREIPFLSTVALVPENADAVIEHIYGAGWRVPDAGFSWSRDRATQAVDGQLSSPQIEEIYWANFYARTVYSDGSSFCEFIKAQEDLPEVVIDIGCGDGRDSYAFAAAGKSVIGVDRSHIGVRHATEKAKSLGHTDITFLACDVNDIEKLKQLIHDTRSRHAAARILFYSRFFLHSIPEETQEGMMRAIREAKLPGDALAAEFRTNKDADREKIHGQHYRRYQDGPAFGASLRDEFGFTPYIEQQGTGFSPYKGEDPELYRVIAKASDA